MTDDRTLERAARSFIEPGPTRAPEAAVQRALLQIQTTPQERDLRIPRRFSTMSMPARVAAAAAIGVLAIGGATFLLGRSGQSGVGTPGPSPAIASSSPEGKPSPSSLSTRVGYPDLPGWIVFEHFGQAPDGSTSTLDFDNRMIWLVRADGSGLHELSPGTPATGKVSPDISPDGSKIAFASWKAPGLVYEVGIDGGTPRQLSTDCSGRSDCWESDPAYSADGKRLAFVRYESAGGESTTVIAVRDLQSGTVTRLETTRTDQGEGYVSQPTWSPDGVRIAYYRSLQKPTDERVTDTRLFVVTVDDMDLVELPQPPALWAADPDWSPDGSLIVFSTAPNRETEGWQFPGGSQVWTIRPDGSDLVKACGPCLGGGWAASWTADGRILFWGNQSWALMNGDGSAIAHLNQPALTWFGDQLGYGYAGFLQPAP